MSDIDKDQGSGADRGPNDAPVDSDKSDTEGHAFMIDPTTARQLSRARSADVERDARDRQRTKEARPNRQRGS
ncbi:MAG: hypothetical protein H0V12_06445 [Chloroflexi bacterium]|nr:hypothetical protein [Chloroflexota bacterium]